MGGASPTGIDQSWGRAKASTVRAAVKANGGVFTVSMYLSRDPSKNIKPGDVRTYHGAGASILANWEHEAGAPLKGAAQGRADAAEAVRQLLALIRAVGYAPRNPLVIYFSCDRDVTAAQIRGPVAAYYRAARDVCHAAGFGVGCYGKADLVKYLAAEKITDAEWQTYAWSRGRLDPAADFYQYQNGQTWGGASVDFDRVIHPAALGAWWPAGHKYNTGAAAAVPAEPFEEIMSFYSSKAEFEAAMRAIVNAPQWTSAHDGYKTPHSPDTVIRWAIQDNATALIRELAKTVAEVKGEVDAVAQVLGASKIGVASRVVALQASVDALAKAVDGLAAPDVEVDAKEVAADVVAQLKATEWSTTTTSTTKAAA